LSEQSILVFFLTKFLKDVTMEVVMADYLFAVFRDMGGLSQQILQDIKSFLLPGVLMDGV